MRHANQIFAGAALVLVGVAGLCYLNLSIGLGREFHLELAALLVGPLSFAGGLTCGGAFLARRVGQPVITILVTAAPLSLAVAVYYFCFASQSSGGCMAPNGIPEFVNGVLASGAALSCLGAIGLARFVDRLQLDAPDDSLEGY
jgi:hypothetical protein